jgi:hypothetical protein
MRRRPPRHENHQSRDILGVANPPIRRLLGQHLGPALQLHQPARHLARVEPRRDGIAQDVPGPELDGQVLGEVDRRGFGGRVGVRRVGPEGADPDPGHRRGDDDARGVLDRRAGGEEGFELLDGVEDGFDVQVHDFLEGRVRMGFESLAPGGAGVGEEDVDVRGRLCDLGGQPRDLGDLGGVGGDCDRDCAGAEVGERVEGADGFFARRGLAGGYVDFGAAGLEEAGVEGGFALVWGG